MTFYFLCEKCEHPLEAHTLTAEHGQCRIKIKPCVSCYQHASFAERYLLDLIRANPMPEPAAEKSIQQEVTEGVFLKDGHIAIQQSQ